METNINPTDITHPTTPSTSLSIKATISSAYSLFHLPRQSLVLKSHPDVLSSSFSSTDVLSACTLPTFIRLYVALHNSLPSLLKSWFRPSSSLFQIYGLTVWLAFRRNNIRLWLARWSAAKPKPLLLTSLPLNTQFYLIRFNIFQWCPLGAELYLCNMHAQNWNSLYTTLTQ